MLLLRPVVPFPFWPDAQVLGATAGNGALRRAAELEERGQFAEAEQIYLAQERQFPKNTQILFHLGTLRMRQHDWPKAIEYLEKCRLLQPRNVDVLFYLAQAHYLNGELVPAQETILIAARLAPKDAAVLQKAGEYLCEGNDCGPGLDDLLKARKLDPALENIDMDLGMAYYKLFKHQEAQAILGSSLSQRSQQSGSSTYSGRDSGISGELEEGTWPLRICAHAETAERERVERSRNRSGRLGQR